MTSKKKADAGTRAAKSPGAELAELDAIDDPAELLTDFLTRRSERTRQSYTESLRDFAKYLKAPNITGAVERLFALDGPRANKLVHRYVLEMRSRKRPGKARNGLSPNTVNQRLYTLRALAKMGRLHGTIDWHIEVQGEKSVAYTDTKGPGRRGFMALVDTAMEDKDAPRRTRNVAILRLGYDTALRRGEVVALDYPEHINLDEGWIWVHGKRRVLPERVSIPRLTRAAIARWLECRGEEEGPLFTSRDRAGKGDGRLTGRGVDQIIKRLGAVLGMRVRFHGLRHAAISDALEVTGGNIPKVQKFSRHRDPRTLMIYNDNQDDHGGEIAELVSQRTLDVDPPDEES